MKKHHLFLAVAAAFTLIQTAAVTFLHQFRHLYMT